ncbi:MAG: FAD-binding oxidoreductase [Candidatus Pacebacteria bacterium]|nr:FAD-binding oxidoreductase [Candidatus Paceibacterota bacterium]
MTESGKTSRPRKGAQIEVAGAGVVGMQTGIELLKKGHRVTAYEAREFDPRFATNPELPGFKRASEVASMQWLPITSEENRNQELRWIEQSLDTYVQRETAARYRNTMKRRRNVELTTDEERMHPSFLEMAAPLGANQEFDGIPENPRHYAWGYDFTTFQVNSPAMLAAMREEFKELGGKLLIRKIESEEEFYDLPGDILINCMGLRARDIFKKDLGLEATKGHMMLFTNPGIEEIVSAEDFIMIPRTKDRLIVGCLYLKEGTYSTIDPTEEEQQEIMRRFEEVMSVDIKGFEALRQQFAAAEHIGEIASERPVRKMGVLVAAEAAGNKMVVHHVGHGGSGWTLVPGSAKDVAALIEHG